MRTVRIKIECGEMPNTRMSSIKESDVAAVCNPLMERGSE